MDFRFWIDPDHVSVAGRSTGMGLKDFKLKILDLLRPLGGATTVLARSQDEQVASGHEPKNLKSKIVRLSAAEV